MIKNIIFDFGGVILNIDYTLAMQEFYRLGIENPSAFYSQAEQNPLFDDLEKGLISPDGFHQRIRDISGKNLSDAQIDKAWNAMIMELPRERVGLLEKTRNKYRTFLLSNTNEIHYDVYIKDLFQKYGYADFSELFEKVYLSHRVNMRKPEMEIFEMVLRENALIPEETLFIDDTLQHIRASEMLGIKGYWLCQPETIRDLFDESGILKLRF